MIPKILHQVWLGPERPPTACIASWHAQHPDWDCHLWTESSLPNDFTNQAIIEAADTFFSKADYIRYELLLRYGGVYADADSYCLRRIDNLLACNAFAAWESEQRRPGLVGNSAIGSIAGHPLTKELVANARTGKPAWKVSGPGYFTEQVAKTEGVTIYPSSYFYPLHHKQRRLLNVLKSTDNVESTIESLAKKHACDAYAIQLWGSTTGLYPWLCAGESSEPWKRERRRISDDCK